MPELTDDDRARLKLIAQQIEYTIKDADWPEFAENDPADPMRDVRYLRELAEQPSSGDAEGLRITVAMVDRALAASRDPVLAGTAKHTDLERVRIQVALEAALADHSSTTQDGGGK